MYNKVVLLGNLTRDVEIKHLPSGQALGKCAIATSRKFKGSDSQMKDEVCFIDITFWGRSAEIANQYLKKGSKVLIDGRLTFEQWSGADGKKHSRHTVTVETMQMLDSKSSSNSNDNSNSTYQAKAQNTSQKPYGSSNSEYENPEEKLPEIDLDDIPF
jgi:single-strand DNA-binding protein